MKLTEIAIEGNTHAGQFHFGPFDRGLNFIYGENGAGKTFLSSFLRGLLQQGTTSRTAAPPHAIGHAVCSSNQGSCALRQTADASQSVLIESLNNGHAPVSSVTQMTGPLTAALHDALFNFSFRESAQQRHDLARLLNESFSVAIGPEAADSTAHVDHQPQIQRLQNELTQLQASVQTLSHTRDRIATEISLKQSDQGRLSELNQQIDQITFQLNQLNRPQLETQLAAIDQQIHTLQSSIDHAATSYVAHAPTQPAPDSFNHLYQRLDEVEQQLERWRHVQSDVQNQRVRLKDEMVVWNELTLESEEHPYHNAREILIGLESRVDQAEQTAARWSGTTASQIDVTQMAGAVEDICGKMRDDLYALCAELSSQYKHIRQRSAAVELKQLRRCYHEMGENTARLTQRRQQVIDDIRAVDPAGADAIQRSEQAFCQCAAHEGYLAARRRFIGNVRPPAPTVARVEPDLSAERARLSQLTLERADIIARLNRIDIDGAELNRQLSNLIQQRESLSVNDATQLEQQLRQTDSDLRTFGTNERSIRQQLDELLTLPVVNPSPILIHAGQLLSQMTEGELSQVFLSHHHGHDHHAVNQLDLQIRDSLGRVHNFTGIDQAAQDHVYLSTALAMIAALKSSATRGATQSTEPIQMPLILDDSFVHIGPDHVLATLKTLDQFCRQHDQQIILLSQHRYLADRLPTMTVFEIPPTMPTTKPYDSPLRTPSAPVPADRYPMPAPTPEVRRDTRFALNAEPIVASHHRPYPLSKYSVTPSAVGPAVISDIIQSESDFRLPWSPLNRQHQASERSVQPTTARAFAERQASLTPVSIDSMSLASTGLFDLQTLGDFHDSGVTTVEQLIELNPDQLSRAFANATLTNQQIQTAQSEALIYWSVPGMSAEDAKLLVAIGIFNPETLADFDADRLVQRVQQFLATREGQHLKQATSSNGRWTSFNRDRATSWQRSLSDNRPRWSRRPRRNQPSSTRSNSSPSRSSNGQNVREHSAGERSADNRAQTYRVSSYPKRQRMDHGNLNREDRAHQPAALTPVAQHEPRVDRTQATSTSNTTATSSPNDIKLKFYLDLNDDLEAAPSIGPKTAERFEKIGIISVADFLRQTAESISTRLKYKRLSADVLRTWQHQTRLVCRIPNLRGHDAQLLVACGVTEPGELAAMDPRALFSVIGPFSDTKEGLKIIRSGKKPDLAEVTDWITWAGHTRSLQAA